MAFIVAKRTIIGFLETAPSPAPYRLPHLASLHLLSTHPAACCTPTRSHTTNTRYPHLQSSSRIISFPHPMPASRLSRQTFHSNLGLLSLPPPLPPDSVYTSCYCEENIYLLAQTFLAEAAAQASHRLPWPWEAFVVFVSNGAKTVRVSTKSSLRPSAPVVSSANSFFHLCTNRSLCGLRSCAPRMLWSGIITSSSCCDQPISRVLVMTFCAAPGTGRSKLPPHPRTPIFAWPHHKPRRPINNPTSTTAIPIPMLATAASPSVPVTQRTSMRLGCTTLTRR